MIQVQWLGHAGFMITSEKEQILIDPWINGNPSCKSKMSDFQPTIIFVTHDHGDHGFNEAVEYGKKSKAIIVVLNELGIVAQKKGVPAEQVVKGNLGGTVKVRDIEITYVKAFHSATHGSPNGFIIRIDGHVFYHAGDTDLFMDMTLFHELYGVEVAFLPIGSVYTMGPKEAAKAVEFLKPKIVFPMHYGTFPVLIQDADEFVKLVGNRTDMRVLSSGETIILF